MIGREGRRRMRCSQLVRTMSRVFPLVGRASDKLGKVAFKHEIAE